MPDTLRKLNAKGMLGFEQFILAGAKSALPLHLLKDPDTSEPLGASIMVESRSFGDRFEFGRYLMDLLGPLDTRVISHDRGLWSALALYYFEQLCPADAEGTRRPDKAYRYVLSEDYRHYYRHLVRSPWQLVRDHGPHARFILLSAGEDKQPLRRHGEMLEQLGAVQSILRSPAIITIASRLYGDPETGRPRRGASGKGGGSVRRLTRVLQQLDLTFDPDRVPLEQMVELLPKEFNPWKKKAVQLDDSAQATDKREEQAMAAVG